ncbi:MAG: hypothetical protein DRN66_03215 [Candidatus Nanohalarchaeota archaeon]|nr:MAG: hypothetical protein DRN66_03215 [Candidatus Nanohaloarchaeota archaeon]
MIQISGLEAVKNLDEFQKEEIYGIIKRRIEKISDISYIYNVTLHAKAYDEESNRKKYVFRCKFASQSRLIFARNGGLGHP